MRFIFATQINYNQKSLPVILFITKDVINRNAYRIQNGILIRYLKIVSNNFMFLPPYIFYCIFIIS